MKQINNKKDNGDDMLMIRTILATRMIVRTIIMLMTMAMTAVTLMMVITLMMAVKITWYDLDMSWYGFVWKQGFPKFCWWIIILPLELLSGGYHFQSHPHDLMMRFCLAAVHLQLQVWPKHWPGGKRLGLDLLGPVATEADRERTYRSSPHFALGTLLLG